MTDSPYLRLPHYLYFESRIRGRSVLEVGCGDGRGAEFLRTRGAARVVGTDREESLPDLARRRSCGPEITFIQWRRGEPLELSGGSVDLVLVPDAVAWLPEPGFLRELGRILAPDGIALFCAATPGQAPSGIAYAELERALRAGFARIRMVGQRPFLGYTLVEYGEGDEEPDLTLDTRLVRGATEPITHTIAVAGACKGELGDMTLVQLPWSARESVVGQGAPGHAEQDSHGASRSRVLELERQVESSAQSWRDRVEELREMGEARQQALERASEAARLHRTELEDREAVLEEQSAYVLELEQELARVRVERDQACLALNELRRELEEAQAQAREARKRVAELDGSLLRAHAMTSESTMPLEKELEDARIELAEARAEAKRLRDRCALSESQTAVWMTKLRESERKAEEARAESTRKLLDAKAASASQLQRTLEESSRKLAVVGDDAARAELKRREAALRLDEAEKRIQALQAERDRLLRVENAPQVPEQIDLGTPALPREQPEPAEEAAAGQEEVKKSDPFEGWP